MKKILIVLGLLFAFGANAYGECSQYGIMAYYTGGYCKCMSGYVMDDSQFGGSYCVSGTTYCYNKYGINSRYEAYSNSCTCASGYAFEDDYLLGRRCVKQKTDDELCKESLGLFSRYNSLYDTCECSYGYVIDKNIFGKNECVYGNTVCHDKHGLNSKYNSLSNKCECDSGYTLNESSKCVEKQNNVYFILKDLDTDQREAVIKSKYDGKSYKISYGLGCLSYTIDNYLNKELVVNLGTDFALDTWDKVVLQDDNQTCNITSKEYVENGFVLDNDGVVLSEESITYSMKNIIPEGALIKTKDNPDIYIVKYMGNKWFKRLILSPSVFKNYGHLRWESIQVVDQLVLNSFTTSNLVRVVGDNKIYILYPQGDKGEKRLIKSSDVLTRLGLDSDSIYEINIFDKESYSTGSDMN